MARPNAVALLAFIASRVLPSERMAAVRWAGSNERLYDYLVEHDAKIEALKRRLCIVPLAYEIREDILESKRAAIEGDPDPATPLDLARRYNIPLEVVRYVADGEIINDSGNRPWVLNRRYN